MERYGWTNKCDMELLQRQGWGETITGVQANKRDAKEIIQIGGKEAKARKA
jgi:hypothetical protein